MLEIDCNFPGGNIIVDRIEGDEVTLRPDLRDTPTHWFYWYFRVMGAASRRLTFTFDVDGWIIGARGPAVSLDGGIKWEWLGSDAVKNTSFTYKFPDDAGEVRFSVGMPYVQSDLERFLDRHKNNSAIVKETLCTTPEGRSVEMLRLGCIHREPRMRVLFTARHHACEMIANYSIEGIVDTVLGGDDVGQWFRENVEFLIVPFMDKDGVEDGDQGKSRSPRDHWVDYRESPRYDSVKALMNHAEQWAQGKLVFYLDMHCPHLLWGRNLELFFVGASDPDIWARVTRFSHLLETSQEGPLVFDSKNNLLFKEDWNTSADGTSAEWFSPRVGAGIATSVEIPYASAGGKIVTQDSARAFGCDLAAALCKYLQQTADGE